MTPRYAQNYLLRHPDILLQQDSATGKSVLRFILPPY